MSDDKRCETCVFWKWAERSEKEADYALGLCLYPQDRLPESANIREMYADQGTTCPCREAKQ